MKPADLYRCDRSKLYGPFADRLDAVLADLEARGCRYYVISGFRSVDEQNALFARGRGLPGPIVTKAAGGESTHNFGIGVDLARDGDLRAHGLQPVWELPLYEPIASVATAHRLESGLHWSFVDAGHLQLPLVARGLDLRQLLRAHTRGGMRAAWKVLDEIDW